MSINEIKYTIVGLVSAILAFLEPIVNDLEVMFLIFVTNAFLGIMADVCQGLGWNKKKAQQAFVEVLLFVTFVTMIYICGYLKHNMNGALQCVSFVSYLVIYYYGTNISRNCMNILPVWSVGHKIFAFIYYILSVEFVKKIPYLQNYNNREGNV